jgi:hypothetical protein
LYDFRMGLKWTTGRERRAEELRGKGFTLEQTASNLGVSLSSVKHKLRRLAQARNEDKYKHTDEKRAQAKPLLSRLLKDSGRVGLFTLETHAGFGGMTELYGQFGEVTAMEVKPERVAAIEMKGMQDVDAICADSEVEIHRLVASRCVFDVVDIDPYGMPSRYFPHAFGLIKNGIMFVTLPMYGVAQMNKLTIKHHEVFWGGTGAEGYLERVAGKLQDFGYMAGRRVRVESCEKLDRVYRFALRVEKASLCDLVGLEVSRNPASANSGEQPGLF